MWIVGFSGIVGLLVVGTLALALRTPRFEASTQGLAIRNSLFGRTIPAADLRLGEAQVVEIQGESGYKPVLRTFGVGLPGHLSGWFKLANGEKALVYHSGGRRAVHVPTRQGYSLLLAPDDPDALLAELRRSR